MDIKANTWGRVASIAFWKIALLVEFSADSLNSGKPLTGNETDTIDAEYAALCAEFEGALV